MNGITLDSVFESTRNAVANLQSQIHFPSIQDANSLNIITRMVPLGKQNIDFHPLIPYYQQFHGIKPSIKQQVRVNIGGMFVNRSGCTYWKHSVLSTRT